MALPATLVNLFAHIDKNKTRFIDVLRESVEIASVSTDVIHRPECQRMVEWTAEKLKVLGATVELRDIGMQKVDGKEIPLPNVIIASLGNVSFFLNYLF